MGQKPRVLDPSGSPQAFLGARLRYWRERRSLSQDELGRLVHVSGDLLGKVERAQRRATPELIAGLDDALAADGALVEASDSVCAHETACRGRPPGQLDGGQLALLSGSESVSLLARLEASNAGPATIEYLQSELVAIARAYVHAPLRPLLARMLAVREQVVGLLDGVQPLGQRRDLLMVTGALLGLLAHTCEDLGLPHTAVAHAGTGTECARQSGHRELQAWIAGTFSGILDSCGDFLASAELAGQARLGVPSGVQQCRLAAVEARAWSHLGATDPALRALAVAAEAAEATADGGGELDDWGGMFAFPPAKRRFYAGNALLWLGHGREAVLESTAAITTYESGPPGTRSYGDEACARADVVAAQVRAGDVAAAREALVPLIELPVERRVASLSTHLRVAVADLSRHRHLVQVADLKEEIKLALPVAPTTQGSAGPDS